MSIVAGIMVPHPPLIVPAVGRGDELIVSKTIEAYHQAARFAVEHLPETIVIASPHAPLFRDGFHVSSGSEARGSFAQFRAPDEQFDAVYDEELANSIAQHAQRAGMIIDRTPSLSRELDHGSMVPLWFLGEAYRRQAEAGKNYTAPPSHANRFDPDDPGAFPARIVRVGLSGLSLASHVRFGEAVREAIEELNRRVVFVASGDLSHKLTEEGPYGFNARGPEYDERIMSTMSRAAFGELAEFPEKLCRDAGECGHRSFTIMGGCLNGYAVTAQALSHEPQTGVGYGICTYEVRHHPYVELAREAVSAYVCDGEVIDPADQPRTDNPSRALKLPPEAFSQSAGAFVSLHKHGELRGCIGTIQATESCIADEIVRNAINAATRDPRFTAVQAHEIDDLSLSVDILGPIKPVASPDELDPQRWGVIVSNGWRRGLLLPRLEGVDTVEQQIGISRRKAGIAPDEPIDLMRFEVIRHY